MYKSFLFCNLNSRHIYYTNMIVLRRISTAIDVADCIGIYTDPNNIYNIIVNTYEGICCFGCYILKVLRIVKTGECEINRDGAPGFGTIPVIFDVQAIVYLPGEIINGCIVQKQTNGILNCNTNITDIMVKSHQLISSLTPGQIVSVRVGRVRYDPGSARVAVNAVMFLPGKESTAFSIDLSTLSSEQIKEYLADVLERIAIEEQHIKTYKETNAKGIAFFTQVLYAYPTAQQVPSGVKVVSLMSLIDNKHASGVLYIGRDRRLDLLQPNIYIYDKKPEAVIKASVKSPDAANNITVVDTLNAQDVLITLFEDYCIYIRTLREMIENYSTAELLKSHANLWSIYGKSKQ